MLPSARTVASARAVPSAIKAITVAPAWPGGIGAHWLCVMIRTPGVVSVICGSAMVLTTTRSSGVTFTPKPVCSQLPGLMTPANTWVLCTC